MLVRQLIELIAPAECLGCSRQGDLLCEKCMAGLPPAPETRRQYDGLANVVVATAYEGAVRELILGLKFRRSQSAAALAARLIARRLKPGAQFDLITAVPIAPARYRERGYNQAELIARALARQLGLPYRSLLGRTTTEHQLGRTRAERLVGVQGAFYPVRRLRGERVLVVDDVLTTGATLSECGRMLRGSGAGGVWGAAVARH